MNAVPRPTDFARLVLSDGVQTQPVSIARSGSTKKHEMMAMVNGDSEQFHSNILLYVSLSLSIASSLGMR